MDSINTDEFSEEMELKSIPEFKGEYHIQNAVDKVSAITSILNELSIVNKENGTQIIPIVDDDFLTQLTQSISPIHFKHYDYLKEKIPFTLENLTDFALEEHEKRVKILTENMCIDYITYNQAYINPIQEILLVVKLNKAVLKDRKNILYIFRLSKMCGFTGIIICYLYEK